MKFSKTLFGLLLSLLLGLGATSQALAQTSKQQAASIAQSRFAGRVIAIKPDKDNGTEVYRVKILDKNGGLHVVVVSVQDGKILSAH